MAARNPRELVSALKVFGLYCWTFRWDINLARYSGHQNGCGQPLQSALDWPYSFYIWRSSQEIRNSSGVQQVWDALSSYTGYLRSWPSLCSVVQSPTTGIAPFQAAVGMFWRYSMHLQGSTWGLIWESYYYPSLLSGDCKCQVAKRSASLHRSR